MTTVERGLERAVAEALRSELLRARARLLGTVSVTEDELATLETHQPGAPVEDAAREQALAVLDRLDARDRQELEEIHAACARLDAGVFGICAACGAAIDVARLRAVPTARRCTGCQARHETAAG